MPQLYARHVYHVFYSRKDRETLNSERVFLSPLSGLCGSGDSSTRPSRTGLKSVALRARNSPNSLSIVALGLAATHFGLHDYTEVGNCSEEDNSINESFDNPRKVIVLKGIEKWVIRWKNARY